MKFYWKEVWSYAVLLVILFGIATVAVWRTLVWFDDIDFQQEKGTIPLVLFALTLGFMFIAGAFGLWAIKFAAEREGIRRVGRFVDAMDYLSDGFLAVNAKRHVIGSNPTARTLAAANLADSPLLNQAFPCLSDTDVAFLVSGSEPRELERRRPTMPTPLTLRFRSQIVEDMTVVMISDVSAMQAERERVRRNSQLQLIGQIARGVAHDFNDLLCGIAGYASLLSRLPPSEEARRSVAAISRDAEKGISLAGQLLELAQSQIHGRATDDAVSHVHTAVQSLRDNLPSSWQFEVEAAGRLPVVGLSGVEIEQVVFNLGMLCADGLSSPGLIRIRLDTETRPAALDPTRSLAGMVRIEALPSGTVSQPHISPSDRSGSTRRRADTPSSGVIESVLRTILDEAGGVLEGTRTNFVVWLPSGEMPPPSQSTAFPDELKAYIAGWRVLLAQPAGHVGPLRQRLSEMGVQVEQADGIPAIVTQSEGSPSMDALIVDDRILGTDALPLLRALLKLCPSCGILVLCENPNEEPSDLAQDVLFESRNAPIDRVLFSMIEARTLAVRRRSRALRT